jgi:uncharacterized protein
LEEGHVIALMIGSCLLFLPLFIFRNIGRFDFLWWMSFNLLLLIGVALKIDPLFRPSITRDWRAGIPTKIALGLLTAAALHLFFIASNFLSRKWVPFAASNIAAVYDFKTGASPARLWMLMMFVIGPGEEIFWRGYLQRALSLRYGPMKGYFLATVLYAGVHLASGNVMLIIAALVCGCAWGWLYLRFGSMLLNVVSHTTWDVMVFLVFPFG